ncbi:hypothetical protein BT63DRAFT_298072 [Microthyrium microscopicum]|uniref:Uncharacterized protein n=1 Tax=Microthyrium microscopicum TaxID=703497 RepID=A0A6A6U8P8_9PEZI|nr:hypothetical protein BT63DRAFT_298072 [Microthyrium microscopicum]
MGQFQASSKQLHQLARQGPPSSGLAGYAGNRGLTPPAQHMPAQTRSDINMLERMAYLSNSSGEFSKPFDQMPDEEARRMENMAIIDRINSSRHSTSTGNNGSQPSDQHSGWQRDYHSNLFANSAFNQSEPVNVPTVSLPPIRSAPHISGVAATAGSPVLSSKSPDSPKRSSPGKRLEHITRHFRPTNSHERSVDGSPSGMDGSNSSQGVGRRWREGLGRRFSRRDRDDDTYNARGPRQFGPVGGPSRSKT